MSAAAQSYRRVWARTGRQVYSRLAALNPGEVESPAFWKELGEHFSTRLPGTQLRVRTSDPKGVARQLAHEPSLARRVTLVCDGSFGETELGVRISRLGGTDRLPRGVSEVTLADWPGKELLEEFLARARAAGLEVCMSGVYAPRRGRQLLALGVDYVESTLAPSTSVHNEPSCEPISSGFEVDFDDGLAYVSDFGLTAALSVRARTID